MVKINGEEQNLEGTPLTDYLNSANYCSGRIAVERNGEIVPRQTYEQVILQDGDVLEIVSFVGGG